MGAFPMVDFHRDRDTGLKFGSPGEAVICVIFLRHSWFCVHLKA